LTELDERITNPADYYLILAYLAKKAEMTKEEIQKARRGGIY